MTEDIQEEDEQPRKRTSSRIQSKGKGTDVSQSSASIPSSKSAGKSTQKKTPDDIAKKDSADEVEDEDLRSRLKEMRNEITKVGFRFCSPEDACLPQCLEQMKAQLERRTDERDSYAKQVKELKEKKTAVADELYDKYKVAADSRAAGMLVDLRIEAIFNILVEYSPG